MLTLPSILVPSELSIARRTHILSIVLSMGVRALSNSHHCGSLIIEITWFFWGLIGTEIMWFMLFLVLFRILLLICCRRFNLLCLVCFFEISDLLDVFIDLLRRLVLWLFKEFFVYKILEKLSVELTSRFFRATALLVANKLWKLAQNWLSKLFSTLSRVALVHSHWGTMRAATLTQRINFLFVHVPCVSDRVSLCLVKRDLL